MSWGIPIKLFFRKALKWIVYSITKKENSLICSPSIKKGMTFFSQMIKDRFVFILFLSMGPPKFMLQKPHKGNSGNPHDPSWWINVFWWEMNSSRTVGKLKLKYSSNLLPYLLTYRSRLTDIKIIIKLYLECYLCIMHIHSYIKPKICFNVTWWRLDDLLIIVFKGLFQPKIWILSWITHPDVVPKPWDLRSSSEHKLRYFWWNLRTLWLSIDSKCPYMIKLQKHSKEIGKIIHVTSGFQP